MSETPSIEDVAQAVADFFWQCQGGERHEHPEPNEGDVSLAQHLAPLIAQREADAAAKGARAVLDAVEAVLAGHVRPVGFEELCQCNGCNALRAARLAAATWTGDRT